MRCWRCMNSVFITDYAQFCSWYSILLLFGNEMQIQSMAATRGFIESRGLIR